MLSGAQLKPVRMSQLGPGVQLFQLQEPELWHVSVPWQRKRLRMQRHVKQRRLDESCDLSPPPHLQQWLVLVPGAAAGPLRRKEGRRTHELSSTEQRRAARLCAPPAWPRSEESPGEVAARLQLGSSSAQAPLCIHLSVWSASARLTDLLISPAPAPSSSLSWRWHYNITSEPRLILKPQLLSPFTSAANVAAASEAALLPSLHTGSQRLIYWSVSLLGLHFTSCYCPQTGCSSPEVRAAVK